MFSKLSRIERRELVDSYKPLAPGVHGDITDRFPFLFINVIVAVEEGNGDVGKYLDACVERYRTIIVNSVHSTRLQGMLMRRGFRHELHMDAWVKGPLARDLGPVH